MLTLQKLKDMQPGEIIATGVAHDCSLELYMTGSHRLLRWVAVRGGIHDWTIYCHHAEHDVEWIKKHGDKVYDKRRIRKLVKCDDEAFQMYRY